MMCLLTIFSLYNSSESAQRATDVATGETELDAPSYPNAATYPNNVPVYAYHYKTTAQEQAISPPEYKYVGEQWASPHMYQPSPTIVKYSYPRPREDEHKH